jgi:D-3-phosphoglycerate dehydrogenase
MDQLKNFRILVTPTSYGKIDSRLKSELENRVGEVIYNKTGKPLSSEDISQLLPGIDGYIAGLDMIDKKALEKADCLKVISRYGVGVDNVDLLAAKEKGIIVTNTPGANSVAVAELTIALILSLARQIPKGVAATRQGQFPRLNGLSIEGKTVGILGLGLIGKQVVRRLAGFDCRVMANDPCADDRFANLYKVELTSLDNLIKESDYISLHLPLLPETRKMVNENFLSRVKQGSYIINTARGELIDEEALLAALKSGHLLGAALDVFTQEPPPPNHPLIALPQVIATPHLGAQTDGAVNAMGWMSYHECMAVLNGESAKYRIV